jgi:hypothetical protein
MTRAVKVSLAAGTVALFLIVAAVAVAVSGLGGGDSSDTSETSVGNRVQPQPPPGVAPPNGADPEKLRAFRDCMAGQGLELPEGGPGGPPAGVDPTDPEARAAFSACRDKLPLAAGGGGPPPY